MKEEIRSAMWRGFLLVALIMELHEVYNSHSPVLFLLRVLVAGLVAFVTIMEWCKWYHARYGIQITIHTEKTEICKKD